MYDFGLEGYRPVWCHGRAAVAERHGAILAAMLGRRLEAVWSGCLAGADRPFLELPALLDFGDDQIEVHHDPAWGVSVTANTVDRTAPIRMLPDLDLTWVAGVVEVQGQHLWAVDVLERPSPDGDIAIGFAFSRTYLTVSGAVTGTAVALGPPDSHHVQHRLASMPATNATSW